jgi:ABC-type Mn2+/Zn2+ transport system ATPase subunit
VKLIRAHATNYRNIIDSNPVEIGQSTCLVGKNEAGKSAFLKAIEGLRSTDKSYTEYGKVTNYPRRAYADYAHDHGEGEARVMLTHWELEDADVRTIATVFGPKALRNRTITVEKTYEQTGTSWSVPINPQ